MIDHPNKVSLKLNIEEEEEEENQEVKSIRLKKKAAKKRDFMNIVNIKKKRLECRNRKIEKNNGKNSARRVSAKA